MSITPEQVREVIPTSTSTFISEIVLAEVLVDTHLSTHTELITEGILELITIYLAAHFAASKEAVIATEKVGDSSISYNTSSPLLLRSTVYGETALMLDGSNTLASLGKPLARLEVL